MVFDKFAKVLNQPRFYAELILASRTFRFAYARNVHPATKTAAQNQEVRAKAIELIQEYRYPRIGEAWQTNKPGRKP